MVLDLLARVMEWVAPSSPSQSPAAADESPEIEQRAATLAERAPGEGVTPAVLANDHDRTAAPLVEYLEPDERPRYVFRGGRLLIGDGSDSLARKHPSKELQVLVSDRRILFVVGEQFSDELFEVPLEDVVDAYLDDAEAMRRYVVVEADREETRMTFFADVTLTESVEDVRDGIAFVADETGG